MTVQPRRAGPAARACLKMASPPRGCRGSPRPQWKAPPAPPPPPAGLTFHLHVLGLAQLLLARFLLLLLLLLVVHGPHFENYCFSS